MNELHVELVGGAFEDLSHGGEEADEGGQSEDEVYEIEGANVVVHALQGVVAEAGGGEGHEQEVVCADEVPAYVHVQDDGGDDDEGDVDEDQTDQEQTRVHYQALSGAQVGAVGGTQMCVQGHYHFLVQRNAVGQQKSKYGNAKHSVDYRQDFALGAFGRYVSETCEDGFFNIGFYFLKEFEGYLLW